MHIEEDFIQDFEAFLSFKKFQDLMKKKNEDAANKENWSGNAGNLRRIIQGEEIDMKVGVEAKGNSKNLRKILEPLDGECKCEVGAERLVKKEEAARVMSRESVEQKQVQENASKRSEIEQVRPRDVRVLTSLAPDEVQSSKCKVESCFSETMFADSHPSDAASLLKKIVERLPKRSQSYLADFLRGPAARRELVGLQQECYQLMSDNKQQLNEIRKTEAKSYNLEFKIKSILSEIEVEREFREKFGKQTKE